MPYSDRLLHSDRYGRLPADGCRRDPGRDGHNQGIKKGEREESQEQGDRIPELADLPHIRKDRKMAEVNYRIIKEVMALPPESDKETAFHTELNIISWNNGYPKLDIRRWAKDRTKCGKGISLSMEETKTVLEAANQILDLINEGFSL